MERVIPAAGLFATYETQPLENLGMAGVTANGIYLYLSGAEVHFEKLRKEDASSALAAEDLEASFELSASGVHQSQSVKAGLGVNGELVKNALFPFWWVLVTLPIGLAALFLFHRMTGNVEDEELVSTNGLQQTEATEPTGPSEF